MHKSVIMKAEPVDRMARSNNMAAGELLSYPYTADTLENETRLLDIKLAKQQIEMRYRLAEIQNQQLYSPVKEPFESSGEFARALMDLTEIEGDFESQKKKVALCPDFNLIDAFKMFNGLHKNGVDPDDLFHTIKDNLGMMVTKNEVFMMFYRLNRRGNGMLD